MKAILRAIFVVDRHRVRNAKDQRPPLARSDRKRIPTETPLLKFPRVLIGALATVMLGATSASAQTTPISITNVGTYFEDFNTMGTTTATSTYPTGWNGYVISGHPSAPSPGSFINSGTTPPIIADDGSDNTGTIHNYGSTGSTDRSLGSLAHPSEVTAGFGIVLVNNTGTVLTGEDILIAFRAEQWHTSSSVTAFDTWTFEYKTGGATLDINETTSTGWT